MRRSDNKIHNTTDWVVKAHNWKQPDSVVKALAYWSEGCVFKPQHLISANVGPLSKDLTLSDA